MQDAGGIYGCIIDTLDAAWALIAPHFGNATSEYLFVVHLGNADELIRLRFWRAAMDNHIDFPLRAIIADALTFGSAALILAHNHPSGDSTPSRADIDATRSLIQAARPLGVAVRDHLIFHGEDFTSFRRRGLL